jgi:hypothetical protein
MPNGYGGGHDGPLWSSDPTGTPPKQRRYCCERCGSGTNLGYSVNDPHAPNTSTIWCPTCKEQRKFHHKD